MDAERVLMIRHKNQAYHALCHMERAIDRRRHTVGPVPFSWLRRRDQLAKEYAETLARAHLIRQTDMQQMAIDLGKNGR